MKYLVNVVVNGQISGSVNADNEDSARVRAYLALAYHDFSPLLNVDFTILSLIPGSLSDEFPYDFISEVVGEMDISVTADNIDEVERKAGKALSEMEFELENPVWMINNIKEDL